MTPHLRTVFLLLAFAGGCQSSDDTGARQVSAEDGVSFARLDGWTTTREMGSLVLTGSAKKGQSRNTITIRTVDLAGWSEPRTPANTVPSVKTVLRALPGATVTGPTDVEHPVYRAVSFDVVFTPPGLNQRRYQRRHIVLFGDTKLIHVLGTAPEGRLDRSRAELERVLDTIREEG